MAHSKRQSVYQPTADSITLPQNQITKECQFCGRTIVVNNYSDRKPRTPKIFDMAICPWCDPRHTDDRWIAKPRIAKPVLWRTIASVRIAMKVARMGCLRALIEGRDSTPNPAECKCPGCVASKYWGHWSEN